MSHGPTVEARESFTHIMNTLFPFHFFLVKEASNISLHCWSYVPGHLFSVSTLVW